jgi:hypothetical protein
VTHFEHTVKISASKTKCELMRSIKTEEALDEKGFELKNLLKFAAFECIEFDHMKNRTTDLPI